MVLNKTTIAVTKDLKNELDLLGNKGDDYEEIIKRNITFTKKFNSEKEFHEWFRKNFQLLGFEAIKEERKNRSPDFIMIKNNKEVRVELETLSSHFIQHKHNPNDVDLVFCLVKDKELQVEVIEINLFSFSGDLTTIPVTHEFRRKLKETAAKLDMTYQNLLEKVFNNFEQNSVSNQIENGKQLILNLSNIDEKYLLAYGRILYKQNLIQKPDKNDIISYLVFQVVNQAKELVKQGKLTIEDDVSG